MRRHRDAQRNGTALLTHDSRFAHSPTHYVFEKIGGPYERLELQFASALVLNFADVLRALTTAERVRDGELAQQLAARELETALYVRTLELRSITRCDPKPGN